MRWRERSAITFVSEMLLPSDTTSSINVSLDVAVVHKVSSPVSSSITAWKRKSRKQAPQMSTVNPLGQTAKQ